MQSGLMEEGASRNLAGLCSWLRVWGPDRRASERVRGFWLGNTVVLLGTLGLGRRVSWEPTGMAQWPVSPGHPHCLWFSLLDFVEKWRWGLQEQDETFVKVAECGTPLGSPSIFLCIFFNN